MSTTTHGLRANFSAMLASTRTRLLIVSRYPGQLFMDALIPIVTAAMPILLGRAVAGDDAGAIFAQNTGTANYVAYMIIGSSVFTVVSLAFWHIAWWLRWEMETGTLEMLYLTPTERIWIAAGTAIYSIVRGLITALIAYVIGSFIFGVNPFQGELLLAFAFILSGLIPLYSLTLLYGALILKLKEANALINVMQWGVAFLMGTYYPIAVLPPIARAIALLFPPTWMTNGARSAILGIGYFFEKWYFDLAVLWSFLLVAPLLGFWVFRKVEANVRRNEGVGTY
jgi:ABC-2 type transport system permease protein